jgi:hypothetical protein
MACYAWSRSNSVVERAREAAPILVAVAKAGKEAERPMKEALHSKSPQAVKAQGLRTC